MASTTLPKRRLRTAWVDQLRGAAVLLMVLDHVLVQVAPTHWLRYTVTRLSLPLFVMAATFVWTGSVSSRRLRQLALAVVVETVLLGALGMAEPGPVAMIALVLVVASVVPWVRYNAAPVAVLGLLQALYLPFPWDGYQPGLVFAWWGIGCLGAAGFVGWGERCPGWFAVVGRRPLAWYCGHLFVLAVIVGVS